MASYDRLWLGEVRHTRVETAVGRRRGQGYLWLVTKDYDRLWLG